MHSLPDDFYYYPQVSKVSYTANAQGAPEVDLLLAGEPKCWVNPTLSREKKKKHLVIANIRMANDTVNRHNLSLLRQIFSQLTDAGFSISIFKPSFEKQGELLSIEKWPDTNKEQHTLINIQLLNIKLPHQQIIEQIVTQYPLSKDQILILDDFWLEHLLNEGKNKFYTLTYQYFIGYQNIFKQSKLPNINFYETIFCKRNISFYEDIKKLTPHLRVIAKYDTLSLDSSVDAGNFAVELFNHRSYTFCSEQQPFKYEDLANITTFEVTSNSSPQNDNSFLKIIEHCPKLHSFNGNSLTLFNVTLSPNQIPLLNTIKLTNCTSTAADINKLFQAAPNLDTLDIINCSEGCCDNLPVMSSLEILSISSNYTLAIQQIKNWAPKLKWLYITGDYNPELLLFIAVLRLENIEVYWPAESKPQAAKPITAQSRQEFLDANTVGVNSQVKLQRLFYSVDNEEHPHPRNYRLEVFNTIQVNPKPCSLEKAFLLIKSGEADLIPIEIERSLVDVHALAQQKRKGQSTTYYGKQILRLNKEWQALASLSPHEQLLAYHVDPEAEIEFAYSQRDNFYYVRNKKENNKTVIIDFVLQVPEQDNELTPELMQLIVYYQKFTADSLTITTPNPTGMDYLTAIQTQKKGVCRHSAFAFKAAMAKQFPNQVRIVDNKGHNFVEIQHNNKWVTCHLSGFPITWDIDESNNPDKIPVTLPQEPPRKKDYNPAILAEEYYLETWQKKSNHEPLDDFCHKLLQTNGDNKCFLELSSTQEVQAMAYLIQQQCLDKHYSIFYVNSPEDLICAAPWIEPYNKNGQLNGAIKSGPGGRFYQFLTANPKPKKQVLLINYANFNADDIVRCHSLIDKKRSIDGLDLPQDLILVGLTNTNGAKYYDGADFYSRFDCKYKAPGTLLQDERVKKFLPLPEMVNPGTKKVESLPLFHSLNWKNLLLGHWVIHGSELIFKEGLLPKALASGLPLVIKQGLWENEDFCNFWQQAKLIGYIEHSGGRINFPKETLILRDETYDWPTLGEKIKFLLHPPAETNVLNPLRLAHFLQRYECDNKKNILYSEPGFIEQAANTSKILNVHLTRDLSEDQWAMLGEACNQHQVELNIYQEPELDSTTNIVRPYPPTLVIASSDVDVTVTQLTADSPDWHIIDVTSKKASDLLIHTQANFNSENLSFHFQQTKMALLKALDEKKKVLLKGNFSAELIDELAPLLLQSTKAPQSEQLILVADDPILLNFINVKTHTVSIEEKKICLTKANFTDLEIKSLSADLLNKETLVQLMARLRAARIGKQDPWCGLKDLPPLVPFDEILLDQDTKKIAQEFIQERKKQLFSSLKQAPYVYLTGLTGVGKTTFVEQEIKTDEGVVFFHGESSMKEWAKDSTAHKLKILFIDEENLSQSDWNELEGLFHNPPSILIDGVYYPLTAEHKVILAGNPLSYGDERKLSAVFARHGNTLLFQPLPLACIYEDILKPVFANTELAGQSLTLSKPILDLYRFLCSQSEKELLISPRELQMIALLTLSHHKQYPQDSSTDAALYYAYSVVKNLVPEKIQNSFLSLPTVRAAKQVKLASQNQADSEFLVTPSRQEIAQQLADVLALNELRQKSLNEYNKAQLHGGLGGIVLTGEPGLGKSELVTAVLRQKGYKECYFKQNTNSDKPLFALPAALPLKKFYRMPVSLPLSVKQALLLQAFDEGAVVVVDELNSSPMLERWFNELLMGRNPITHKPAKIPGFCLIGTQNPVNMAGRKKASPAFIHRLIQTNVPVYPPEEMECVLESKGLSKIKAQRLVKIYEEKLRYAQENYLKPQPTFRDLLHAVDIAKKGKYANALQRLQEVLSTFPEGKVKESARSISRIVSQLRQEGGRKLASYLSITTELLLAAPEKQAEVFARLQQKAMQARDGSSFSWNQLANALYVLGVAATLSSVILLTLSVSFTAIVTVAVAESALLLTGVGIFSSNKKIELARAIEEFPVLALH